MTAKTNADDEAEVVFIYCLGRISRLHIAARFFPEFESLRVTSPKQTRRTSQLPATSQFSMHRSLGHHARVQLDFAEGILVPGHILLQHSEQCLGLLRAQINSLEVLDLYLRFSLLQQGSENQEEIPDVDADLHAVGVVFAVCGSVRKLHVRLNRIRHKAASVAVCHAGRKRPANSPLTIVRKLADNCMRGPASCRPGSGHLPN